LVAVRCVRVADLQLPRQLFVGGWCHAIFDFKLVDAVQERWNAFAVESITAKLIATFVTRFDRPAFLCIRQSRQRYTGWKRNDVVAQRYGRR